VAQAYLSGSTEERLYTLVFRCFGVYWRGVRRLIR
jgi:hypothetical protein